MIVCDNLFGGSEPAPATTTPKRRKEALTEQQDKFVVLLDGPEGREIEMYRAPYESLCLAWLRFHKADIHDGWGRYKTDDGVLYLVKRLGK
ncbi:MAG: hypothetical protein OHK0011_00990 [Turneriella sp.]